MLKRTLIRFAVVVSAVLCVVSLIGWIRSHRTIDLVVRTGAVGPNNLGHYYELVTIPGQFRITRVSGWWGKQPIRWYSGSEIPPWWPVFGQQAVRSAWLPVGIGLESGSRRINSPALGPSTFAPLVVAYQIVAVPYAVPALVFGAIALLPLVRRSSRRQLLRDRVRRGLCPTCGYDLRGTPGHCPECGNVVANARTDAKSAVNTATRPADAA